MNKSFTISAKKNLISFFALKKSISISAVIKSQISSQSWLSLQ